jgi:peptidyl-prolyl cis-trans isomerase D
MLQQMRTFTKSWVANLFLGLIALSFVAWGIGDMFKTRVDTNIVTMGSSTLPYDTFSRDYRNILRTQSQRLGRQITPEDARKSGFGKAFFDKAVERLAQDSLVDQLGITIPDDDLVASVHKISSFYGPLGSFDRATFLNRLQEAGYTEAEFLAAIRSDMARGQLLAPVEAGFSVPDGYAHALFTYATELRAAEYVTVSAQSLGKIDPPSDAVLSAYIKAHAGQFSTPEYRSVSVAMLGADDIAPTVKISDAQIAKQYDDDKATYIVPEKRAVQQITFPSEAAAKDARAKIDGGLAFEATAFQAKLTVDDRGTVSKEDLGPLGDAAFAVPEGGVTQPVKNFASWVLLHVTKVTPGKTTTLDQAKPEIVKKLTDQTIQAKLGDVQNAFSDASRHASELPEAAKAAGMHVAHVLVDAQGLGPDGKPAQGIPADPDLIAHIFAADVGEPSDPFITATNHVYAVSVEGVTPPKPKTLDQARVEATQDWTAEQTQALLKKRADQLAREAQGAGTLANIAQKLGAPVQTGVALSRQRGNDNFSAALMDKIFSVPGGGVVSGPNAKGDAYIIARVTGVLHPPIPPTSPGYRQGLGQLAEQMGEDLSTALANDEKARLKVSTNQKLLDQALGGGGGDAQ